MSLGRSGVPSRWWSEKLARGWVVPRRRRARGSGKGRFAEMSGGKARGVRTPPLGPNGPARAGEAVKEHKKGCARDATEYRPANSSPSRSSRRSLRDADGILEVRPIHRLQTNKQGKVRGSRSRPQPKGRFIHYGIRETAWPAGHEWNFPARWRGFAPKRATFLIFNDLRTPGDAAARQPLMGWATGRGYVMTMIRSVSGRRTRAISGRTSAALRRHSQNARLFRPCDAIEVAEVLGAGAETESMARPVLAMTRPKNFPVRSNAPSDTRAARRL